MGAAERGARRGQAGSAGGRPRGAGPAWRAVCGGGGGGGAGGGAGRCSAPGWLRSSAPSVSAGRAAAAGGSLGRFRVDIKKRFFTERGRQTLE